jgi:hypothetical protein
MIALQPPAAVTLWHCLFPCCCTSDLLDTLAFNTANNLCPVLGSHLDRRLLENHTRHLARILHALEVHHGRRDLLLSFQVNWFALARPGEALLARPFSSRKISLLTFKFLPRKRLSLRTSA